MPGGLTEADGVRAGEDLLRNHPGVTAVAAFNDRCAAGVLATLRAAGRRVPEDVSVIGFDDDRLAGLPGLDLTTVRQDAAELATLAVTRLTAQVEGRPGTGREAVVAPHLIVRTTTARPPT